jgi:hypothetical protein
VFIRKISPLIIGLVIMPLGLAHVGNAAQKDGIQKYFNDTTCKVKKSNDPVQKRKILDNSLQTMSKALDVVESAGLVSEKDRASVDRFKTSLREKQDELLGRNGYDRVSDAQLNAFSDYVVQDMEQADRTINISLVAALLVVIIIILIV